MISTARRSSRGRMTSGVDAVDVAVGETVRLLRLQAGLTQAELGRAIGVTFQQVQKYERAANRISASMLVRIASAVNVPVSELFPQEDDQPAEGPRLELLPRGHALAVAFAALSAPNQMLLISLAEAMASSPRPNGHRHPEH